MHMCITILHYCVCVAQGCPTQRSYSSWSETTGCRSQTTVQTGSTTSCCCAGGKSRRTDPHSSTWGASWRTSSLPRRGSTKNSSATAKRHGSKTYLAGKSIGIRCAFTKTLLRHKPSSSITCLWSPGAQNSSNKWIIIQPAESIKLLQCSCKSSCSLGPYWDVNIVLSNFSYELPLQGMFQKCFNLTRLFMAIAK